MAADDLVAGVEAVGAGVEVASGVEFVGVEPQFLASLVECLDVVDGAGCRAPGSLRMGGFVGDGLGEDDGSGCWSGAVRLVA